MTITANSLPPGPAWLFCPADRTERFAKAAAAADVVILDLEDGVTPSARPAARASLAASIAELDASRVYVRVNPASTEEQALDLAALAGVTVAGLMLTKAESRAQVEALAPHPVVALCETPLGIVAAAEIASAENCVGLMWGAEDLVSSLGGTSARWPDGTYRDFAKHARNTILIAAASAGKAALDTVYLDLDDLTGLGVETVDAAASGFAAKVCLHPKQTPVVREAYAPTAEQVDWATRVLEAADAGGVFGAFSLDGRMVDEPVIRQARRILERVAR